MARFWTITASCLLLAACGSLPPPMAAPIPLPEQFDQADPRQTATPAIRLWQAFDDPKLLALLHHSIHASPTLELAHARLEEARALAGLEALRRLPASALSADAQRSRTSAEDPLLPPDLPITETYRGGIEAVWEIDLAGALRNARRAAHLRAEAEAETLRQLRIGLIAETAQGYFALRAAQRREALANDHLTAADEALRITTLLERAGRLQGVDLARARSHRETLAAALPLREAERIAAELRLATLSAQPVAALRGQLGDGGLPALPPLVTVGTPAEWLLRRPDLRAAERRLTAAGLDIEVERAQFLPQLRLLGGFGFTGQEPGALGDVAAQRWQWGPVLQWRLLDAGRIRQQVRAAEARADAAAAHYRQTLLLALEETEAALANYRSSQQAVVGLAAATEAAREATRLSRLRFAAGSDDALALLGTEQQRIELEHALVQAEAARAFALATLYRALAGDFAAAPST